MSTAKLTPEQLLEPVLTHRVRSVAKHGTPEQVEALCEIAARRTGRVHFTPEEWDAVLAKLDAEQRRVRDWLAQPGLEVCPPHSFDSDAVCERCGYDAAAMGAP